MKFSWAKHAKEINDKAMKHYLEYLRELHKIVEAPSEQRK